MIARSQRNESKGEATRLKAIILKQFHCMKYIAGNTVCFKVLHKARGPSLLLHITEWDKIQKKKNTLLTECQSLGEQEDKIVTLVTKK